MINQFLESVVVIDTETTAADPQQAEIVELATAVNVHNSWSVNSVLFGCVAGMPPEASEVTGISNRMLAGLPRIDENMHAVINMLGSQAEYFVAHNAQYDRTVLVRAFENSSVPELAQLFADPSRWICTLRLSRHMYGSAVSSHRQNYLRYALDLDVDDSLGVHRAGADVQVCAALLQTLVQDLIQTGRISADQPIAAALLVVDKEHKKAYGRYWGALEHHSCLHFETAFYQSIEYCISSGIEILEGGAQGEHKMARGFMPKIVCSYHYLTNPSFADAVERFLERERLGISAYRDDLAEHSPLRQEI